MGEQFNEMVQWIGLFALIGFGVVASLFYGIDWAWRKMKGIK